VGRIDRYGVVEQVQSYSIMGNKMRFFVKIMLFAFMLNLPVSNAAFADPQSANATSHQAVEPWDHKLLFSGLCAALGGAGGVCFSKHLKVSTVLFVGGMAAMLTDLGLHMAGINVDAPR
jgi:hypothetical protein